MKYRNLCTFDGWVTQISAADTFEDRRKQTVTVCRYTLAVPRPDQGYDYIPCIAFGSRAWYAARNLSVGTCVTVIGHIHSEIHDRCDCRDGGSIYGKCSSGGSNPFDADW